MRAIPGRAQRSSLAAEPAEITRTSTHADQRRRILRATAELIAKRGYNDVRVELIVKRAHVSFKTYYTHYGSKQDAFIDLFDSATARASAAMNEAASGAGESWPAQIDAALRALYELIAADPAIARTCLVESLAAGPLFIARYEQVLRAAVPLLAPGRELSKHGAELPMTLEDTIAGSVSWFLYQRLVVGELDQLRAQRGETLEFILRPYLGDARARKQAGALAGTVSEPD